MKKYISLLIIPFLSLIVFSCEEEQTEVAVGNPEVSYIRSTDPAKADSLLVGAFMGAVGALFVHETRKQGQTLSPAQVVKYVNQDEAVVVDVRDDETIISVLYI